MGMGLETFTLLHVLVSLVGIGSGLVVMYGFLVAKPLSGINAIFVVTTVLTSVTGFMFPFEHLLPSHKIAILSLVILAVAIAARYMFHLSGPWCWIYVVTGAAALYLNVFVLVFQSFVKVPALKALAPTQAEPPFLVSQLTVLLIFVGLTILAVKRFHTGPVRAA